MMHKPVRNGHSSPSPLQTVQALNYNANTCYGNEARELGSKDSPSTGMGEKVTKAEK